MYNLDKKLNENKIESIDQIINGMKELLSGEWDVQLDEDYPFEKSLDELLTYVIKWRNTQDK